MKPAALDAFTDDELLEELQRRRNAEHTRRGRDPIKPCDACLHFIAWRDTGEAPENYNPCDKGHTMQFRQPIGPNDDDSTWGFYRRVCPDREPSQVCRTHGRLRSACPICAAALS